MTILFMPKLMRHSRHAAATVAILLVTAAASLSPSQRPSPAVTASPVPAKATRATNQIKSRPASRGETANGGRATGPAVAAVTSPRGQLTAFHETDDPASQAPTAAFLAAPSGRSPIHSARHSTAITTANSTPTKSRQPPSHSKRSTKTATAASAAKNFAPLSRGRLAQEPALADKVAARASVMIRALVVDQDLAAARSQAARLAAGRHLLSLPTD